MRHLASQHLGYVSALGGKVCSPLLLPQQLKPQLPWHSSAETVWHAAAAAPGLHGAAAAAVWVLAGLPLPLMLRPAGVDAPVAAGVDEMEHPLWLPLHAQV
jgi:hypothetical protein